MKDWQVLRPETECLHLGGSKDAGRDQGQESGQGEWKQGLWNHLSPAGPELVVPRAGASH